MYNRGIMMPLGEWLKPPKPLLLVLFLLTAASVSAVVWFGWRLYKQENIVQSQRSEERLEQAAERIAATVRGALAESGERLGTWELTPPAVAPGDLLLVIRGDTIAVASGGPLLYSPVPSADPEANPAVFADAELLEFAQGLPEMALEEYRRLAASGNAAIRAGALLREGRVLRRLGRTEESRGAYLKLASAGRACVAGAPAELVARSVLGDTRLKDDLLRGRWRLTRGQFQFYWQQTSPDLAPPADAVALAEAATLAWDQRISYSDARGQQTLWADGQAFFVIWRGAPDRRTILINRPESFLKKTQAESKLALAFTDTDGRIVAGQRSASGHTVVRAAAETQLPWTLYVSSPQQVEDADLAASRRFLVLGTSSLVLFLILGAYFIARVIRREAETVRMQSDFVSAVSHEFRSPLTSMRQLSEMLAEGRVQSVDRRQLYYETLVKETTRLQRLIEGLLNFGRMDAGARHYRFETLNAANLVQRVVSEFEPQVSGQGRRIQASSSIESYPIEGDPEAIGVALRNLVDNALRYSPDQPIVWVDLERHNGCVAIRVRDKGPGIAESERKAIFRRFVRGSAAKATNAKGSGVGLTMVRHIVAAHGGEITLASTLGQGSEFTMLLPVRGRNR